MNYVQETGNRIQVYLPDIDPVLLSLYTLLVFTKGVNTSLENVHDAWACWRNLSNPHHKSLILFDDLTEDVQELDRKYALVIRKVSSELFS